VPVVRQYAGDALLAAQHHRHAVGQAVPLVEPPAVKIDAGKEQVGGLVNDRRQRIGDDFIDERDRQRSRSNTTVRRKRQYLNQHRVSRDLACRTKPVPDRERCCMELITTQNQTDIVCGVRKDARHQSCFGAPYR
jgi:hypothetical protein